MQGHCSADIGVLFLRRELKLSVLSVNPKTVGTVFVPS